MSELNSPTPRSVRRGVALAALFCLNLGLLTSPAHANSASSDSVELPPLPEARAYHGNRELKDYRKVLEECEPAAGKPSPCVFELKEKKEYNTALVSVGNVVENCTDDTIVITKEAELTSSSTDNIGGEISGSAMFEGTINNTATVTVDDTAQVTGSATKQNATESTHQTWSPHSAKANSSSTSKASSQSSATATGQNTAHVGATDSVLVGARASFTAAFRATFSKSWTSTTSETTTQEFRVRPGRTLHFGASFAMANVTGDMTNKDTGKRLENFSMHTPSTANSSRLIAQAFNSQNCPKLAQQQGNLNGEQGEHNNQQSQSGSLTGNSGDKKDGGTGASASESKRGLRADRKSAAAENSLVPGKQPVETWTVPLN
ncbi:hypothetical protein GCM10018785_17620 [Streptomyces longispororuber]|uniref:Uncharacterized protein n=1 Tax=Streptomyces longispororuber TaxID=68230 RepID=A0A918ZE90_9ACTN|nr:hypothetical protein [Streptomyces longispororuber]GHE48513.1 hypothetical protein GCM10018785_17620 [Streptomyces longispororuber]